MRFKQVGQNRAFQIFVILASIVLLYSLAYYLFDGCSTKIQNSWKRCINESVDPCEDFYDFVCSNYEPDLTKRWPCVNIKMLLIDEYESNIEKCLNDSISDRYASRLSTAVQKMRQFRDIHKTFQKHPTKIPVSQLVKEIESFGSCPLLNPNWSPNNFNLTSTLLRLTELTGQDYLFQVSVYPDSRKSPFFVFTAINPINDVPDMYFFNSESKKYVTRDSLIDVTTGQLKFVINEGQLKMNHSDGEFLKAVQQLVNVNFNVTERLGQFAYSYEAKRELDKYGHFVEYKNLYGGKIRFNELDDLLPVIGGSSYYMNNSIFLPNIRSYLAGNPLVYADKNAIKVLNDYYIGLDKEILANYLCTSYINSQIKYFDFDAKKYIVDRNSIDIGDKLKAYLPTPIETTKLVKTYFPLVVDHLFINKCMNAKSIEVVQGMVDQIKWGAEQILAKTEWLDEKSRKNVLLKLKSTKSVIGAYNTAMNVQKLDQYYENLNFSHSDTYRKMILKLELFNQQRRVQLVMDPEQIIEFMGNNQLNSVFSVYYFFRFNVISILGGKYMSYPVFDLRMPQSVRFGSIGSIIGHELFHSFGPTGILFDAYGARSNLFKNQTMDKFHDKSECLIYQYTKIRDTLTGRHLNGIKTFRENLADLEGLKAAYLAYKHFVKTDESVSGFEHYNSDQSFFIGNAIKWCAKTSYKFNSYFIDEDTHSLPKYRVNEVLKNMPEFANAFKCSMGSKMNPIKKCNVF